MKYVKGGNKTYSASWLYNKLMAAKTQAEIDHIKEESAPFMNDRALKYLNSNPDTEQYPGARVNLGPNIYMYQWSASSAVE